MPLDEARIAEVKGMLAAARQREINFGLCLGGKAEDTALVLHRNKSPEALGKAAKAEAGTAKMACGTLTVEGKTVNLTCLDAPPSGIAKRTRSLLNLMKLNLHVSVLGKGGIVYEQEGEEEEEEEGDSRQTADDSAAGAWASLHGRLEPLVLAFLARGAGDVSGVRTSWGTANEVAGEGDYAGALRIGQRVETLIGQAVPEPPPTDLVAEKKWLLASQQLAPHVEAMLKKGTGQPDKIRAVWAFAQGKAETKDYAAALKSLGPLAQLIGEARDGTTTQVGEATKDVDAGRTRLELLAANWASESGKLGLRLEAVLTTNPTERSRIEAVWGLATERAARAAETASEADYATAFKALAELKKLLDTAVPETKAPEGTVDKAAGDIAADQKLKSANTLLAAHVKSAEAALARLREEFKPALPDALDKQAKSLVLSTTETDPDKIEAVAKTLAEEVVKLDQLAVAPRAERLAWTEDLSVFEVRLLTLENHPLNAEATVVKPLLDAIRDDFAKAKLEAGKMAWAEASKALKLLLPLCDAAEQTADGLAHYNAIRQDRVDRLATLPLAATITEDQPKKVVEAAQKLLADADLKKTAKKFDEGVALLNDIPDAVAAAAKLVAQAADYATEYPDYETKVTTLENFTGVAATAIATGLADFRSKVQAAKIDVTNDYIASMDALAPLWRQYASLEARANQAKGYTDALQAFETRLTAVKDHPGRIAIEEFYARMQADQSYANDRIATFEYEIAAQTLNATVPLHQAQIDLAEIAKDYKAKHKKAGEDIDAIEKAANGGKAAAAVAEARLRITAAESAATGKDWPGALKAIEQAASAIAAAQNLLADDKELADKKDGSKLDAIATDFAGAIGVYDAMRLHVAGKDTTNTFTARLATADAPAQRARDEAAKAPAATPDFVKARADLDTAIGICEATLLLIAKKAPYDTALAGLKTAHTTTLPGLNVDDCIRDKIDAIGQRITRAETLAKAEAFDFDGAQQEIGAALLDVRQAERDAAAYAAMKPDVQTITTTLAFLKDPARAAGLADEIKRLEDAGTAINNDVTAGNFPAAAKTAAAAAKLCPGLEQVGRDYVTALANRKSWVLDALPAIEGPGKEACAPEVASVKQYIDQMKLLFDDHIYGSVTAVASSAYWVIEAAKAILAAAQLYEPARALAESKLTTALANRNAATEGRYDALRERYDAAVEIAAGRNYDRAIKMLTDIPVQCDGLAVDAQAFRAYEASRQAAGLKLGEAMKSKQALAIRPLLVHLKSRHDAAVKIADGGDYAGAKTLLDAITVEGGTALTAAGEYGVFATMAEDLKKKPEDGGSDLAQAIVKVEQLHAELLAKPEALYVVGSLTEAGKVIKAAKALPQTEEPKAREALGKAVDACAAARIGIGHYAQMEAEMKALTTEIDNFLKTHAQAGFVKDAAETLLADIEASRGEARATGGHQEATKQLEAVDTKFIALKRAADAQVLYLAREAVVEPDLEKMEKHAQRYIIKAEIDVFRKDLTDAAGLAAKHDHKAAMAVLDQAADTAAGALLKAKMHANEAPDVDDVKKILAGKNGSARLDEMVATLDPQAKSKVLNVAFEARFGCKLNVYKDKVHEDWLKQWKAANPNATADQIKNQENFYRTYNTDTDVEKKAPNIRRFYDLMCELPDTHTKDNDSMQVFTRVGGPATGSDYGSSKKEVTMREGEVGDSGRYGVGLSHEIEAYDPGCEPLPGEPASYFDWNTLHEVGHAVDDKLGFMKARASTLAGWTEHGGNVRPIADAVAGKFSFDRAYVAAYMAGTADPVIPEPDGCDAEEWERRRVACRVWVDRVRNDKQPWQTTASAKDTEIGGICYQESYPGVWTSYPLAERKKGISGYQFRAPGEWFSELYAAYHTGKLKGSHPAVAWLSTL